MDQCRKKTIGGLLLAVALAAAVAAQPASAATVVGNVSGAAVDCSGQGIGVQDSVSGAVNGYVTPAGVITSWRIVQGPQTGAIAQVKVLRSTGTANQYRVVGESSPQPLAASAVNRFDARVPTAAGDRLGLAARASHVYCSFPATGSFGYTYSSAVDFPIESVVDFVSPVSNAAFNVEATVEPDADHDGYGDETQDGCTIDATRQGTCATQLQPDAAAPALTTGSPQKVSSGIELRTGVDEASTLRITGTARFKSKRRGRRARTVKVALRPVGRDLAANTTATIRLALPKKIKRALRRGITVRVTLTVEAKDRAGNVSRRNVTTTLAGKKAKHRA